jgi:antitoxin (DNA-binding transcriptional repressor) of toxin-antitoxin stability system
MQVSLEYAKEHLADLVSAAYRGEEVEIAAPDQPSVRFTLVSPEADCKQPQSLLGSGKGEIWLADDWDSDETNAEIADLFENSAIFPETDPEHHEEHPGA